MTSCSYSRVRSLTLAWLMLAALINICASRGAAAQAQMAFPGASPSAGVVRSQNKAKEAYQAGDYERAFWFYRKELAPIGDKYAQYMVGHMIYHGLGVPRDQVLGAAWFSLAAERGHEQFVELVDVSRAALKPEQLEAAHELAIDLKSELGDVALVKNLIRYDLERLRESAGSRLGDRYCSRSGRVYSSEFGSLSMEQYCTVLNHRIDQRVAYISGYVEYGELELLPDENDVAASGEAETD